MQVRGWRGTIVAGFNNTFPGSGKIGRTLEILEAELSFSRVGVPTERSNEGIVAVIRFNAKIFDKVDNELGTLSGTVFARNIVLTYSHRDTTENAATAVEQMYETIAKDLLEKH